MRQRDSIELEAFILLKVARAAIRMDYSIKAERKLNDVLPTLEKAFWEEVQQGALPDTATAAKVFDEVYNATT